MLLLLLRYVIEEIWVVSWIVHLLLNIVWVVTFFRKSKVFDLKPPALYYRESIPVWAPALSLNTPLVGSSYLVLEFILSISWSSLKLCCLRLSFLPINFSILK